MRGYSVGWQCNGFGFAIGVLCAWADGKTPEKVKIQPGLSVLSEQGENTEWFRENEKSGQIYQPVCLMPCKSRSLSFVCPFVLFGFYLVVALGGFTVS